MNNIRIMAHRGYPVAYPENTMISFKAASKYNPEIIETDVRKTKDGVLVINHDEVIDRTSNGTGLLRDYTYEELLNFDFGNPKQFGDKYKGTKIVTLKEAITFFETTDIEEYWLEVKEPENIDLMCETVISLKASHKCVFNLWSLKDAKEIRKYTKDYLINHTGILEEFVQEENREAFIKECVKEGINKGSVEFGTFFNLDPKDKLEFIKLCCDNNIKLGIWTMDDIYSIARAVCFNMNICCGDKFIDFSFDNFTTNNVVLGLKFLGRIKE